MRLSATSSSNFVADKPMYAAAKMRESPRGGSDGGNTKIAGLELGHEDASFGSLTCW